MANKKNDPASNLVNSTTRELMSKKLPFVLQWGNILLLLLLLCIAGLAWIFPYPAEVQGMLLVNKGKPVIVLYAPEEKIKPGQALYSNGKLLHAFTSSAAYRNAEGLYQVDVDAMAGLMPRQPVLIKAGSVSLFRKIFH